MKRIFLIAGLATAFLLIVVAASAQKANFAGTWSLDKAKSQGLNPRMQGADSVTWTITQDDKSIAIDQKVTGGQPPAGGGGGGAGGGGGMGGGGGRGGAPAGPQSYNLDGKEATSEMAFGQATGKLTTKATMSGGALELMRKSAFPGQDGTERVTTTTQKLSLSGDGKTLTVVAHSEGGRGGPSDSTMVFNKQ
jgi:hypothetical protein